MDSETLATAAVDKHTDEFDAMTDRDLLLHVARKMRDFERLASELMTAVEGNPMAKMLLGKIGGGRGIFG